MMDEVGPVVRIAEALNEPCPKCHQTDHGQVGEYPCPVCGIPTLWGDAKQVGVVRIAEALEGIYHLQKVHDAREVIAAAATHSWLLKELGVLNIQLAVAKNAGVQGYQASKQMEHEIKRIEHELEWIPRRYPVIKERPSGGIKEGIKEAVD